MRIYLTFDGEGKRTVELVAENQNEKVILGTFIPEKNRQAERFMALPHIEGHFSNGRADKVMFVADDKLLHVDGCRPDEIPDFT